MKGYIRKLCGIWRMMGGMEKDVYIWYVILMDKG
jgi:hypothetical protein